MLDEKYAGAGPLNAWDRNKEGLQQEHSLSAKVAGVQKEMADAARPSIFRVIDDLRSLAHALGAYPNSVLFTAADMLSIDSLHYVEIEELRRKNRALIQQRDRQAQLIHELQDRMASAVVTLQSRNVG